MIMNGAKMVDRLPGESLLELDNPMTFKVVMMTPDLAEQFLKRLHPKQRKPKLGKIAQYATDMIAGRWRLTHVPIGIDDDGFIVDGMNRLYACHKAKVSVPMLLCYGVPSESIVVVDCGAPRTANDAAKMAGIDNVNPALIAVARHMVSGLAGISRQAWSHQVTLDMVETYKMGLEFSFRVMPKKQGISIASVRAVLARAWYSVDHERLVQFAQDIISGLVENPKKDGAAVMLRNWLTDAFISQTANRGRSRSLRDTSYAVTEFALDCYINQMTPAKLLAVTEELFPIPDLEKFKFHK